MWMILLQGCWRTMETAANDSKEVFMPDHQKILIRKIRMRNHQFMIRQRQHAVIRFFVQIPDLLRGKGSVGDRGMTMQIGFVPISAHGQQFSDFRHPLLLSFQASQRLCALSGLFNQIQKRFVRHVLDIIRYPNSPKRLFRARP